MVVEKGYKLTEVGVIPEDWEVKTLGEILKFGSGKDYKHLSYGDYPVYGTGGIMTRVNGFLYDGESVGIGRKGTIDKPVYLKGKFWTVDTLFYTHTFNNVLPKFIYYKFLQVTWKEHNEASGVPSLNKNTLDKIKIAIPPLHEQTAIANALSDMDALIAQTEKLIVKKKAIKQGVMQELLKPKEGWVTKKLGEVLQYEQPTKYIVKSDNYSKDNLIPVLTAGKSFILGFTSEEFGIFSDTPTIIFDDFTTASQFVDFKFKVKSSAMKILKPKISGLNMLFMFEIFQNIHFPVADHKRHWIGEFQHIEVFLPNIGAMNQLGNIIHEYKLQIQLEETKLQKLKNQKQGMMQALLTGKIRLV